ncbi:MAG: hypothetical protein H7138_10460, partial [Myxococcales bacterium]|nr:hypothetical protein [Myxococcales bacterium]
MTTRRALAIVVLALVGCGGHASFRAAWPDVQLELRDDADRLQAIDELWITPVGPARDRLRTQIAAALVARITDTIDEDQPFVAARRLDQLCALWQSDPAAVGPGLARYAALLRKLRGVFAKSGALEPAIQTLVLLIEIEPAARAAHLAELDEVLAFAD